MVARRDDGVVARITAASPLPGVRAGSALVRVGGRLLAIQDDAFRAVWIDPATLATRPVALHGAGEAQGKELKPDFEAAFVRDGRVFVLGSGSRSNRCCFARLDLDTGETRLFNALPLYGAIADALGREPNIEGAVPLGDRLRLFHRGPGRGAARAGAASCAIDVPLAVIAGGAPRILSMATFDLGRIGDTQLAFTDAVALGRFILYLAVAEDTPDAVADGPVGGAAVGILDGATARWDLLTEADGAPSRRKVEGVALDAAGGGWLLTDPDDAARPAELCRVELKF